MHPGFIGFWKARCAEHLNHHFGDGAGGCGPGDCGPGSFGHEGRFAGHFHDEDGATFGVRRPLRFLAHKLELSEPQVAQIAAILNELKTERAQAAVDQRRRVAALADVVESGAFDEAKVGQVGVEQLKTAERLREAVATALRKLHAALNDEQRRKLAYLLRTGVLVI